MAGADRLRGLVGQGMNGRRPRPVAYAASYASPGAFTWTAPSSGWFRFVLWGSGASGNTGSTWGGGSGAFYQAERNLVKGQTVAGVLGAGAVGNGGGAGTDGAASTLTLPTGEVMTAGGGVSAASTAGGTATANKVGDIVFNGSAGGTGAANGSTGLGGSGGSGGSFTGGIGGGAGAPGYGPHFGGKGADCAATTDGAGPGAGGAGAVASGSGPGGDGLAIIYRVRFTP